MKGLLKNNLYATLASAKAFSVFMLLWGIFSVAVISQSLQIGFVMVGIVGFSLNAIIIVKNESASKWGKYKLTLPVKRADIVRSLFANQIVWMLVGTFFAGIELSLSSFLHGSPFDQRIDILSMFALGISISLFMGAIFFPLFYLGGEERCEVFMVISLLCAGVIDFAIVSALNDLLEPGIFTILTGAAVLIVCSAAAFAVSGFLTIGIFKRKEYT